MEKVDCFKYLGLLLSSDLSFGKHITICSKARKITGGDIGGAKGA